MMRNTALEMNQTNVTKGFQNKVLGRSKSYVSFLLDTVRTLFAFFLTKAQSQFMTKQVLKRWTLALSEESVQVLVHIELVKILCSMQSAVVRLIT